MTSEIFSTNNRERIQSNVLVLLNENQLMNNNTADSPRAVGDAVQSFLEREFFCCLPKELIMNFSEKFVRRAMADFAFEDNTERYYVVDLKTHNLRTSFNMPNITSVDRLAKFYEDDKNYFALLLVDYTSIDSVLKFESCHFVPIEYMDWSCLTIGALGWGQIQIANSNRIVLNTENTRRNWMLQLCDALDLFYPKEISKITARIDRFIHVREYWENKPE